MPTISLYAIDITARHKGDITVSSKYDWWFYAEVGAPQWPDARRVKGTSRHPTHDRELTSEYARKAIHFQGRARWAHALHSYVAMHEWKLVVAAFKKDRKPISPKVHRPLHELVHRVEGCESGISDEHLLALVLAEEQAIVGYTRANPFRKVANAKTR